MQHQLMLKQVIIKKLKKKTNIKRKWSGNYMLIYMSLEINSVG